MKYEEPIDASRADFDSALKSRDPMRIVQTMLGLVAHDPDWRWLQETCLSLLNHDSAVVRANAVTALGHVARIHGTLDKTRVEGALRSMEQAEPSQSGRIADARDDIAMFARAACG